MLDNAGNGFIIMAGQGHGLSFLKASNRVQLNITSGRSAHAEFTKPVSLTGIRRLLGVGILRFREGAMNKTYVDPKKVNLAEADIEQWLFDHPEKVTYSGHIQKWVGRQFKVPSGIIDLLGIDQDGDYIVVEVNNTEITAEALTQVSRYAKDIEEIIHTLEDWYNKEWYVMKLIIGKGEITNEIQFEADALDIGLISFRVQMDLDLGGRWSWTAEYKEKLSEQYSLIGLNDAFIPAREAIINAIAEENSEEGDEKEEQPSIIEEAKRVIDEENEQEE